MKKLLLTAAFAMMSFAAFAQDAPNASEWKIGDDVSEAVGFGNLSFENDPMDCWTFNSSKGSTTTTGGLFECYDGADCDLFQVILIPAGMYELNCQGYYRAGTSWDADPNSYANGTWENLSALYAVAGTYNIDSKEFTETSNTFSNPLMPRLFEEVYEQIYVGPKDGEEGYPGWDMSDGQYNQVDGRWAPCSVPGTKAWFDNDKYLPFESDEDETVYNKLIFFVTEDTWVKVGVQKINANSADSFFATNFHLIYKGDADEAAKIALAYKALEIAQRKAEVLADEIIIDYPALGALLQDEIMELSFDDTSVPSIEAATAAFNEMFTAYTKYYEDAKNLAAAVASMEELAASTDYSGKTAFELAIDAARAISEATDPSSITGPEAYGEAIAALTEAKGAYILTRPAVDGVYNYSDMINQPFFCNNEYNPTWDEDLQQYVFNEDIESTWSTVQEKGYTEQFTVEGSENWTPFCSNVTIASNGSDEGRWVINSTTWHGGGPVGVTIQHSYPAIGGWTAEPSGNPELLHQTITNLPNGYYNMSALMCNAGADISPLMYVYIKNSEGIEAKAGLTQKGNPWWGGNKDQWRQTVWEKLETDMIEVNDGRVTIGSSSDSFYAVTGFQLYYYGENPDFTAMVNKKLASVTEKAESLTFAGDITYVESLLGAIPASIIGFEEYDAAKASILEAEEYIQKAVSAVNGNTLSSDYDALFDKYTNPDAEGYIDGPVQSAILEQPMEYVALLGINPNDVYTDIAEAKEVYNAYKSYLSAYDQASTYDNAELKTLMETQANALKAGYSNVETLKNYTTELNFFVKREMIIAEGGKNASEENPSEVTSFIVNPDFSNGPTYGWSGNRATTNEYARGNAEIWNANPVDMYQVIKGLPAGKYEVRVRALYRDHNSITDNDNESWTSYWTVADGDVDAWERHFAELYASTVVGDETIESASYVKSVCDGKFTEPSFTKYYRNNSSDLLEGDLIVDESTGKETIAIDTVWTFAITAEQEAELLDAEGTVLSTKDGYNLTKDGSRYIFSDDLGTAKFAYQLEDTYPFDTRVKVEEGTFFYPSSMVGAYTRFNLNPEAYCNSVQIEVPAGADLRIGFRKNTQVDGDWIIFDDFQLFYLGGNLDQKPDYSAINEVVVNKAQKGIFNIAGQQMKNLQKGLNIVDGKKIFVK